MPQAHLLAAAHALISALAAKKKTPTPTPTPSAAKSPRTPTPSPSGSGSGNKADQSGPDALTSIIDFLTTHLWIPAGIVAIVAINIGWRKLIERRNLSGQPLPPLGFTIKRVLRIIVKEDTTPVLNRPQNLAQKTTWLTWRRYWAIAALLAAATIAGVTDRLPPSIDLALTVAVILMAIHGAGHIRRIFQIRHRILMQMFEVANSECRYLKGAELNPWAYIQISKWRNLYYPDKTTIMFPPRYRSEDPKNREAFELNFNGTVSDAHTWTYTWESANNRVIAEPVPYITTNAPYPFPDTHDWNEFPLGIAAGGKEVIWDCGQMPHSLVAGTSGSGKNTSLRTRIPTPSGWTTMGDLRVGDQVFDEQGKPCTVTWISDINEKPDLYEVVFSDGSIIEADAEHLWFTETQKVRESRNNTRRKAVKRRLLISQEKQEALLALAASVDDDHDITLSAFAAIAGVNATSPWLIEVADRLGPVGEIQVEHVFHYTEQVVAQKQKVRVYDAENAYASLAAYDGTSSVFDVAAIKSAAKQWSARVTSGQQITAVELAQHLGLSTTHAAGELMTRCKVSSTVVSVPVQLKVPAKQVRRKGPWSRTYSTKLLVAAVLQRVERPASDQRHLNSHGSVKTTAEIRDTLMSASGHRNHAIPLTKPLDLPEVELPIHPYVLGVWLGDGVSRRGEYCGTDHEVVEHVQAAGYPSVARRITGRGSKHADFRIWKSERLHKELGALGLLQKTTEEGSRKHIPSAYLRASIPQRRALLAGLLDTDGAVAPQGTVQFANTNERLARQVHELALTLGYRPVLTSGLKRSQTGAEALSFTVSWTCLESPFWLTRKTTAHRERNTNFSPQRNATRFITEIRPVPAVPARCIQVDSPSRLFLAGDAMIPTHNSVTQRTILLHALQQPDMRVLLIDPKRVELSGYADHPHVLKIATELDESTQLFEQVEAEMQSRYQTMKDQRVNYFKNMQDPPPALLVMVDEAFALLSPENVKSDEGKERDEMHARCTVLIGSIARLGRAAGIHLVLATQRPDAKVIPGEVRNNLDARIAQGRMDTTPSLMTLDSDAATRLPPVKGRAVYRAGNETTEFQAYFLPPEYLPQVLEMSAALATGMISPEDLQPGDGDGEGAAGRRWRVRVPLPGKLTGSVSGWAARRRAAVERNEAEARKFARSKRRREPSIPIDRVPKDESVEQALPDFPSFAPEGSPPPPSVVDLNVDPFDEPLNFDAMAGLDDVDEVLPDVVVPPAESVTKRGRSGRREPDAPAAPGAPVAAAPGASPVPAAPAPGPVDFSDDLFGDDVVDFDVEEAPWMPLPGEVPAAGGQPSGFGRAASEPGPATPEDLPPLEGSAAAEEVRTRGTGRIPPPPR